MAEKEPRLVRPVEEQSSEDVTENTGKNENAIYPTFISLKGNVKFFPEKPPIADGQKAEVGKSLPEVETTVSSHIEEMFRAKVRSPENNKEGLLEVMKSKDDSKEAKKEKGKKKKKKKIRRMKNRVMPLDDTKDNADDNGIAGSEVDAARNKKTKIKEKKKVKVVKEIQIFR